MQFLVERLRGRFSHGKLWASLSKSGDVAAREIERLTQELARVSLSSGASPSAGGSSPCAAATQD